MARGDLLLHWTFDEAASGDQATINRGTVPGLNGTFNGGATRTTDTPGGASPAAADLLVVGNGYVTATDPAPLDGLEQITITAWIKLLGDPTSDGSGNDRIAALQDGTASFNGFSLTLNAPSGGVYTADNYRMAMFVGGTDAFAFERSDDVFELGGEWAFVATTYDGLSDFENLRFYVGEEEFEVLEYFSPRTAAAGPIAPVEPGTGFHLGRTDAAPDANTSLEGYIDDVRIYDEVLDLAALEAIRMEGLTDVPPPLDLPGDYSGNGLVEQADLDLVLGNWGAAANDVPATWMNDPPEGFVDQAELDKVLGNWGSMGAAGSSAAAVPEPHSIAIGLMAAFFAAFALRRRG